MFFKVSDRFQIFHQKSELDSSVWCIEFHFHCGVLNNKLVNHPLMLDGNPKTIIYVVFKKNYLIQERSSLVFVVLYNE